MSRPSLPILATVLFGSCLSIAAAPCANTKIASPDAQAAASQNAASLYDLTWSPFGRVESGWSIYVPLVGHEIGSTAKPDSPEFAESLASWQGAHGLPATGILDPATFLRMKTIWQSRRPFVSGSRSVCPAPPAPSALSLLAPDESYGGKQIWLRSPALKAYRDLVAAARAAIPELAADNRVLTAFSGYRSPEYDAARCVRDGNCQGVVRAACSPHRTGLALDLYLGAAPGYAPDSSADANRAFISRTAAYQWLVANAARFGFANYAFEPWHWEWTGAAN